MSKYEPREAVSQLKSWIGDKIINLDQGNKGEFKERYQVVVDTINNIKVLDMTIPDDLVSEKEKLEEILDTEAILRELQQELSLLVTNMKQSLSRKSKIKTQKGKIAPRKKLTVTFSDGITFCEENATATFIMSLAHIGLGKIAGLVDITSRGHPLVSKQKNRDAMSLRMVDGYYIETHSGTEVKARKLELIANVLNVDITIDVL